MIPTSYRDLANPEILLTSKQKDMLDIYKQKLQQQKQSKEIRHKLAHNKQLKRGMTMDSIYSTTSKHPSNDDEDESTSEHHRKNPTSHHNDEERSINNDSLNHSLDKHGPLSITTKRTGDRRRRKRDHFTRKPYRMGTNRQRSYRMDEFESNVSHSSMSDDVLSEKTSTIQRENCDTQTQNGDNHVSGIFNNDIHVPFQQNVFEMSTHMETTGLPTSPFIPGTIPVVSSLSKTTTDNMDYDDKINTPPHGTVGINRQRSLPTLDVGLYNQELQNRLHTLGVQKDTQCQNDHGTTTDDAKNLREKELAYWKKKVSLEEEIAIKQAGMFLRLLSNVMETFTNAVGFKFLKINGLSTQIEHALKSGSFDLSIKHYITNPGTLQLLQNPIASFITSFGHVIIRTHLANIKREREAANTTVKSVSIPAFDLHRTSTPKSTTGDQQHDNDVITPSLVNSHYMNTIDNKPSTRPAFSVPINKNVHSNIGTQLNNQLSSIQPMIQTMHSMMEKNQAEDKLEELDTLYRREFED